ncbi:cytochrome C [Ginsengibacter hankyongi]|uniref:Cytochrome C n=1 Tax=Ginsengibacter hankyongi TaxID=2607284 RepID=A0A5J5IEV8_9BACT|nr:cytochrome c peroxidase [Ginsengibacter hankyongi]KAA9038352.1 cytochrome C [Ginsengibacter hankyongi]
MKKNILYIILGGILLTIILMQGCMKEKTPPGPFAINNIETLGKNIFFDKISVPDNMSCASCHAPDYGFTGSAESNISGIYEGAFPGRYGNRKPPSAAYAAFSPILHYDGLSFIGGNFWDGRATGERLKNPAAEQALGPFLNPLEMNNPSKKYVLKQIAKSSYAKMWKSVWGEPISYSEPDIEKNYDRVGLAIAAYEASSQVSQFSSKFDYYLKGKVQLSKDEEAGRILFNGNKAQCSSCHLSDGNQPLFTDFTFENIGTPKNPDNPFYKEDKVYLPDGQAINPAGNAWIDPGLGGFLITRPDWSYLADANLGKQKVPTLRNVDKRNGPYMHNGVFKSLKEVVHFYNTRDISKFNWPAPEVPQNVNAVVGNLGLTDKEENEIVAFLKTLSDGY